MPFYQPFLVDVKKLPLIVYPHPKAERAFKRNDAGCLEKYILQLYRKNEHLVHCGQYHIVILWGYNNDRMADVWTFDQIETWGSGPFADVKIFREYAPEHALGGSAGDALMMLGREEEHRRTKATLKEYVKGPRPTLPKAIMPKESFYISNAG